MATLGDLLNEIFGGKKSALYYDFEVWARGSRRFRAFAMSYHSKIRAKVKNAQGEGGMLDLRAELETAMLLLGEERFAVEYEKYAALKQRGPDFTVTYKTHTPFNVEVRRIRGMELEAEDHEARTGKLMAALCDKVGQMPPSITNLLWFVAAPQRAAEREIGEDDLKSAVTTLRQLAEGKNEAYFTRRGFESAADFIKQYQKLSGIVLRQTGGIVVWVNSLGRHQVPPEIVRAIERLAST